MLDELFSSDRVEVVMLFMFWLRDDEGIFDEEEVNVLVLLDILFLDLFDEGFIPFGRISSYISSSSERGELLDGLKFMFRSPFILLERFGRDIWRNVFGYIYIQGFLMVIVVVYYSYSYSYPELINRSMY